MTAWFLIAFLLTGTQSGLIGIDSVTAAWPLPFATQQECLAAAKSEKVIDRFYPTQKHTFNVGFVCQQGILHKVG